MERLTPARGGEISVRPRRVGAPVTPGHVAAVAGCRRAAEGGGTAPLTLSACAAGRRRARPTDFLALTKPRVVLMVLVTALAGFYVASPIAPDLVRLAHTLAGIALAAGGTLALNQYLERDVDGAMARTRRRPLPDGRLRPADALGVGVGLAGLGLTYLAVAVNLASAAVVGLATVSYLFVYTPLKRRSDLCALVGAVPGALPPVAGWVAARGEWGTGAWILFGILFLWQLPHTRAIALVYSGEYACAGLRVAPAAEDPGGTWLRRPIVAHCAALFLMGLLPALAGMAGPLYLLGAGALGAGFVACGVALAVSRSERDARRLLYASLIYLPLLLALLAIDRIPH